MNDLNCKSKITVSVITAIVTVILCVAIFIAVLFGVPGVLELIQLDLYVDSNFYGETSKDAITEGVLSGYLNKLDDRYAQYYNKEQSTERENRLNGVAQGLGITVLKDVNSESIYVARVYEDSPAKESGILKGDRIIGVDGKLIADFGYSEILNSIPREIGETVNLTIIAAFFLKIDTV